MPHLKTESLVNKFKSEKQQKNITYRLLFKKILMWGKSNLLENKTLLLMWRKKNKFFGKKNFKFFVKFKFFLTKLKMIYYSRSSNI